MRLSIDPRDGAVRLTLPRGASLRQAHAWAETKRGWIEAALSALPPAVALHPGATFPFEGREVTVTWADGVRRTPTLEDDRLLLGGPREMVPGRVLRWLRAEALARLGTETAEFAALAGVTIGRVGIGDPRSRWGSCSASGDIRYSWRLVLAPVEVRRATVAHEVAHRLHMHHGPTFHQAVADLLGREPTAERAWLREHGAGLHRVGA